jgi:hypothetical protein
MHPTSPRCSLMAPILAVLFADSKEAGTFQGCSSPEPIRFDIFSLGKAHTTLSYA